MSESHLKKIKELRQSTIEDFVKAAEKARIKVPWPWDPRAYKAHLRKQRTLLKNRLCASLEEEIGDNEGQAQHYAVIGAGIIMLGHIREFAEKVSKDVQQLARSNEAPTQTIAKQNQEITKYRKVRERQSYAGKKRADANRDRDTEIFRLAAEMEQAGELRKNIRAALANRFHRTPTRIGQILSASRRKTN